MADGPYEDLPYEIAQPRRFPQKPGAYELNTKVALVRLKDRGLLANRIIEAGGDLGAETITLEEYVRRDAQWTEAMYNEIHGPVADLRDEARGA